MKLLLSLILIITIAFNNCSSFRLDTNKIDYSKFENQQQQQQQCFASDSDLPKGYNSYYAQVSSNGNIPGPNGAVEQLSYAESGYFDIDFIGQQMYVEFFFDDSKVQNRGKLWGFTNNNTQYVSINVNGTDYCFYDQLSFSIPAAFNGLKYVGEALVGNIRSEVFKGSPALGGSFIDQALFVDKTDCSLIISSSENINSPSGYSLLNFFSYQPYAESSNFQLPSICSNPISTHSNSLLKDISFKLPKIIKQHPF
ncbi:hypothetical protein ACTA71_011410 [Dictyostelium dimigraforme]